MGYPVAIEVYKKMLFIKILYSYIFPVFSVLNTKDEPRKNQGTT